MYSILSMDQNPRNNLCALFVFTPRDGHQATSCGWDDAENQKGGSPPTRGPGPQQNQARPGTCRIYLTKGHQHCTTSAQRKAEFLHKCTLFPCYRRNGYMTCTIMFMDLCPKNSVCGTEVSLFLCVVRLLSHVDMELCTLCLPERKAVFQREHSERLHDLSKSCSRACMFLNSIASLTEENLVSP